MPPQGGYSEVNSSQGVIMIIKEFKVYLALFSLLAFPLGANATPEIVARSPLAQAVGVSPMPTVSVTFAEAMNPSSITANSFIVTRPVKVTAIASGSGHSLALREDGTVVGWGLAPSSTQRVIPETHGVVAMAAGQSVDVFLHADGTVTGWGEKWVGAPVGLTEVVGIASGGGWILALKRDGSVVSWGGGYESLPLRLRDVRAIAAGGSALAIVGSKRKVVQWNGNIVMTPPELTGVTAIAAGIWHNLAVKDGRVIAWYDNQEGNLYGQCNVPAELIDAVTVAAGRYHSLALRKDGTVIGWGDNRSGQVTVPEGLINVVAIAAGDNYSLALTRDGEIVGWGSNGVGQLSPPATGLYGVVEISRGSAYQALALMQDGKIESWGTNWFGQSDLPEGLSNVIAVDAGTGNMALKSNGTVVTWGHYWTGEVVDGKLVLIPVEAPPTDLSDVVAISNQGLFMGLKRDGTVAAWGPSNKSGELDIPVGLADVVSVTAAGSRAFAVKADGSVVRWGDSWGCSSDLPLGVAKIFADGSSIFALKHDNSLVDCGCGGYSGPIFRDRDFSIKVKDVAMNPHWMYVLTEDGKLYDYAGQNFDLNSNLNFPHDLSDGVAVATYGDNNTVLRADGSILSWGNAGGSYLELEPRLALNEGRIAGTIAYNPATFTATFVPNEPLQAGANYEAKIFARNEAGQLLPGPAFWSFTVANTAAVTKTTGKQRSLNP